MKDAISKVRTQVNTTVTARNYVYIDEKDTVHEMLKALKARLTPNTQAEELRIRAEYRQLQSYDKRENISA